MRYVLDASVAIKWIIPEDDSDKADQIAEAAANGIDDLVVPDFFPYEVANALSRLERPRQGQPPILQPMEGAQRLIDIISIPMRIESVSTLLPRAYELSSQTRSSVFDCLYIALAEQEGCNFITADARIVNNLRNTVACLMNLKTI